MKNFLLPLTFLLYSICSFAQIGKQIHIGMANTSLAGCNLDAKGKTGFEIGYSLFAKYSDRLEWTSGFGYINGGCVLPAYKSPGYGNPKYQSTDISMPMGVINVDYQLSYYILPNMLAITGGGILGAIFNFAPDDVGFALSNSNLSEKDASSTGDAKIINLTDLNYKFFQAGLSLGGSFTYNERFMVYARYNFYLTKSFDTKGYPDMEEILGNPKMRILRIGLAYKFLPSARNKRF